MKTQIVAAALVICALLAVPSISVAEGTNSITPDPYSQSFEGNNAGYLITNMTGWSGSSNAYVTNVTSYGSFSGLFPISYNHTVSNKALYLDQDALTNTLEGGTNMVVYCDFMGQLGFTDTGTVTISDSNVQLALLVDTNSHLILYHKSDNSPVVTDFGNQVLIGSDEWVRVTILVDHNNTDGAGNYYFQMKINNGAALTNANGFNKNTQALDTPAPSHPGNWFVLRNNINDTISSFSVSGKGQIDDLVIGTNEPPPTWTITASAVAHCSITPASAIVTNGGSTNFDISVDNTNFYYIADILTNNATIGGIPAGLTSTNWTWNNITTNGSIFVTNALFMATHNVPRTWLNPLTNATYPTWDAASDADSDGDGMTNWQEYIAETNPNDTNSVFKIRQQTVAQGSNTIEWVVFTNSTTPPLPPYGIERSTNLIDPTSWGLVVSVGRSTTLTNTWSEALPVGPAFYRIIATNAP